MKPETKIVAKINRTLRKLKQAGEPVCWGKVHGNAFVRRGEPDLDIVYDGVSLKLEVKQPGKMPTKIQAHRINEWAAAGSIADVIHSADELIALIEWIRDDKKNERAAYMRLFAEMLFVTVNVVDGRLDSDYAIMVVDPESPVPVFVRHTIDSKIICGKLVSVTHDQSGFCRVYYRLEMCGEPPPK